MKQFEVQIKDFGQQFSDQIKCLDTKLNVDNSILTNIHDLYKRKSAIEQEYSENLFKLCANISQKNKSEDQKRPKWKNYSPGIVLTTLLASTQRTARAHRNLSDVYGKQMTSRLVDMQEDNTRLTKKCNEMLTKQQAVVTNTLQNLQAKQRQYQRAFAECDDARKKALRSMEQLDREVRRNQTKKKEVETNAKIMKIKDDYLGRAKCFKEKQDECAINRNKYIIHLAGVKATLHHFYNNGIKSVIKTAEYGFHNNLSRLCLSHASCEDALFNVHESAHKLFINMTDKVDLESDTEIFLSANTACLKLRELINFCHAKDDNVSCIIKYRDKVEEDLHKMKSMFTEDVDNSLTGVKESKEKLEKISQSLNDLIDQPDYDVGDYIYQNSPTQQIMSQLSREDTIGNGNGTVKENTLSMSREKPVDYLYTNMQKRFKENRLVTEHNYLTVMDEFLLEDMKRVNYEVRKDYVVATLNPDRPYDEPALLSVSPGDADADGEDGNSTDMATITTASDGTTTTTIQPQTALIIGIRCKLFGGDLKRYSEDTRQLVPVVVRSCIRLIHSYGMHNQGVFRIPGSQTDVVLYKSTYEYGGRDPFHKSNGNVNDINLAASILKLYFRELDPPIFDRDMFHKIVDNYDQMKQDEEVTHKFLQTLLLNVHEAVYATAKYLLAFLSHLAEFSADNCMDVMNLAIIFGPCLMPIPEEKSHKLFQYQGIVNHIAQCLITHYSDIFSAAGPKSAGSTNTNWHQYEYRRNESSTDANSTVNQAGTISVSSFEDTLQQTPTSGDCQSADENCERSTFSDNLSTNVEEGDRKKSFSHMKRFNLSLRYKKPELRSLRRNESSRFVKPAPMISEPLKPRRNSDSEEANAALPTKADATAEVSGDNGSVLAATAARDSARDRSLASSIDSVENLDCAGIGVSMRLKQQQDSVGQHAVVVDEDMQLVIGQMNAIEELNIRKNRSTLHIDTSVLTKAKFVSPIHANETAMSSGINNNAPASTAGSNSTFRMKKPGGSTVFSLASTFEMTSSIPPRHHGSNTEVASTTASTPVVSNAGSTTSINSLQQPPVILPKPKLPKRAS